MKTQMLSGQNASVNLIGFLLIVATPLIGCGVFVNHGTRLTLKKNENTD